MEQLSLFGDEFNISLPEKSVKNTIKKVNNLSDSEIDAEKVLKSKKINLAEKLSIIETRVIKVLGKQKDNILVIKDKNTFDNYISEAIKSGRIAIDTETNNSLDPITCKLMGLCLYYPGGKQAYIPINHRNPETKERLSWQPTEKDCKEELQKINESGIKQILHNGKFDYEVIKCTCDIEIKPYWDTMVAARLLNENELAGLKKQYIAKIDPSQEKYDIENLFENVAYADVDPDIFAYYAATDSLMTDKLYELQSIEFEKPEYDTHLDISGTHEVKGLRWLFHEVEMPITIVTAEMELRGVKIDTQFGERLKIKYTTLLEQTDEAIAQELNNLSAEIEAWKLTPEATCRTKSYPAANTKMSKEKIESMYTEVDEKGNRFKYGKAKIEQLEDPINLASPTQLAIIFYDILKVKPTNKTNPRATGVEELKAIDEKQNIPLCKLILKRRGIMKLITTYIDVIPELAKHWPDGRIRFHLSSLGTDTGRYSSGGKIKYIDNYGTNEEKEVEVSGINIQNIPSHNPEIRALFVAQDGYRIIGSDYSAQEPRMSAFLSSEPAMYEAYTNGKDLYAMIASSATGDTYDNCLEFWPEGTELEIDGQKIIAGKKTHLNKHGKENRNIGKKLLLAATYGMGGATAGANMGKSREEGEKLLENFFNGFPVLKKAIDDSKDFLRKTGYVEDFVGRRRRLDDINLPKYEVVLKKSSDDDSNFNPFINCVNREVKNPKIIKWEKEIQKAITDNDKYRAKKAAEEGKVFVSSGEIGNKKFDELAKEALKDGVELHANTGRIAQAERQCFNARIQGSAASLTKMAMVDIFNDPILKEWDTHLIITVHDEVLVECPEKYAELVEKRLPEIMINAAKKVGDDVPQACDPYNVTRWYAEVMAATLLDENKKLLSSGVSKEEATKQVCKNHIELPEQAIIKVLTGETPDEVIF